MFRRPLIYLLVGRGVRESGSKTKGYSSVDDNVRYTLNAWKRTKQIITEDGAKYDAGTGVYMPPPVSGLISRCRRQVTSLLTYPSEREEQ